MAVGVAVGDAVGAAVGTATHSLSPTLPSVQLPSAHAIHSWYCVLSWYLPLGQR